LNRLHRIVMSSDNIITITKGGLLYRDEQNVTQWIDFKLCRENWLAMQSSPSKLDRRYVGCRNTETSATVYVRFFSTPPVIFAFKNAARRNLDLIQPMSSMGWFTTICIRSGDPIPEE
jgi:hypothetical protein